MKYARINEGSVVEICTPVPGFTIHQCFHIDLVKDMVSCADDVQAGWSYNAETGEFTAPAEPEPTPE
jgi:hypothetical protein